MVIGNKSTSKGIARGKREPSGEFVARNPPVAVGATTLRGVDRTAKGKSLRKNLIVIDAPFDSSGNIYGSCSSSLEPDDVIDLGAPRGRLRTSSTQPPRAPALYTPNPRLYPGSAAGNKNRRKTRSTEGRRKGGKRRGRERKFTKPVPNSRLYRPAAARPAPPPQPRGSWPPPAPARSLDTASRAALRLLRDRRLRPPSLSPVRDSPAPPSPSSTVANAVKARRLVVTLPALSAAECGDAPRYRPASEHFRLRARPPLGSGASTPPPARAMAAATNKHSTSPDCSDGNDASSAPSEFLAEFLSAIMRRQYAEALKYCQLILQYEPHNSTARGFYPLLQHKVSAHATTHRKAQKKGETSSESEDTSARKGALSEAHMQKKPADTDVETEASAEASGSGEEDMEQGADGSGSACSSLELDSEPSAASPSPRTPRRSPRDTSDPNDTTDPTDPSDSASWRWESDDNGNPAQPHNHNLFTNQGGVDDVENDNALMASHSHLKSESVSSLQRLRAQFTCSIK